MAQQFQKQENLDKAKDTANRAVGLFISVGKDLQYSERKSFLTDIIIPLVERCLSDHVEPRVLKNYTILMFFIQKVSCTNI